MDMELKLENQIQKITMLIGLLHLLVYSLQEV